MYLQYCNLHRVKLLSSEGKSDIAVKQNYRKTLCYAKLIKGPYKTYKGMQEEIVKRPKKRRELNASLWIISHVETIRIDCKKKTAYFYQPSDQSSSFADCGDFTFLFLFAEVVPFL